MTSRSSSEEYKLGLLDFELRQRDLIQKEVVYPLVLAIIIIVFWHYGSELSGISSYTLPQPGSIVTALFEGSDTYLEASLTSLKFVFTGYVSGAFLGLIFAFLIFSSDIIKRALYPVLIVFFILPKILIAPIFVLWLGAGPVYYTLVPLTLVFFPITENTLSGLNGVPENLHHLSRIFQSSTYFKFRNILVPHSLPSIAAGLKIGMRQAVIGVIVAEFVAPEQGLGQILIVGSQYGEPTVTWAGIILIGFIGIVLYKIVEIGEHQLIFWKGEEEGI